MPVVDPKITSSRGGIVSIRGGQLGYASDAEEFSKLAPIKLIVKFTVNLMKRR